MIEVVFNSSAAGSLKVAQRFGKGKYPGAAISVFICHEDGTPATEEELEKAKKEAIEKAQLAWERAVPLGGSPADVFCFDFGLSVGELTNIKKSMDSVKESMEQISERMKQGEALRIWFSSQPDELCGLCWFLDWLNQFTIDDGAIVFVKLPEWESGENGALLHRISSGELMEHEWHQYIPMQKVVSRSILQTGSTHWKLLVEENAPLRAIINGQLVSASEDIYDSYIRREIDKLPEEFYETKLIGKVLEYRLGIGDVFIHSRIEQMILAGKLEVAAPAEDGMPAYRRLLRKIHEID